MRDRRNSALLAAAAIVAAATLALRDPGLEGEALEGCESRSACPPAAPRAFGAPRRTAGVESAAERPPANPDVAEVWTDPDPDRPFWGFRYGNTPDLYLGPEERRYGCSGIPYHETVTEHGGLLRGIREGPWVERRGERIVAEGEYRDGEKEGLWRRYRRDGSLEEAARYAKGRRHGLAERFHPSGALAEREGWVEGRRHGEHRRWNEAGVPTLIGRWAGGLREGVFLWFDEAGALRDEEGWRAGRPHGVWTKRLGEVVVEEAEYDEGRLDGAWRLRDEAGRLLAEGFAAADRPVGTWWSLWPDGRPRVRCSFDDRGRLEGRRSRRDEEGRVTLDETWRAGRLDGERVLRRVEFEDEREVEWTVTERWSEGRKSGLEVWRADGRLREELPWKDGVHHGTHCRWNDAGVPVLVETLVEGEMQGLEERRWDDGRLRARRLWADDECHGLSREWDETGRLIAEGRYELGEKVGTWRLLEEDEHGRLVAVVVDHGAP